MLNQQQGPGYDHRRRLDHVQRVFRDYVEDLHYRQVYQPGDFVCDGTGGAVATVQAASAALVPVVVFVDGFTTRAHVNLRVRDWWRTGLLELTILYSGDTASTSNIRWNAVMAPYSVGESFNALSARATTENLLAAGPAAAHDIRSATFTTRCPVDVDDDAFVTLRISRDGAHGDDAYAGEAYLMLLIARYAPKTRAT